MKGTQMLGRPSTPGVLLAVVVGLVVAGLVAVAEAPSSSPVTLGGHQSSKSSILFPARGEGSDGKAPPVARRSIDTKQGQEVLLGRTWQADPTTCDSQVLPTVVVTSPSEHGRIEVRQTEFIQRRLSAACARRPVRGLEIFYRPDAAFAGTDRAGYRVTLADRASNYEFTIHVTP